MESNSSFGHRSIKSSATRRAAAAVLNDLVHADHAKHVVHSVAEAARWAFVVRALRTNASGWTSAIQRQRERVAALVVDEVLAGHATTGTVLGAPKTIVGLVGPPADRL